jgi:hypothetical protein
MCNDERSHTAANPCMDGCHSASACCTRRPTWRTHRCRIAHHRRQQWALTVRAKTHTLGRHAPKRPPATTAAVPAVPAVPALPPLLAASHRLARWAQQAVHPRLARAANVHRVWRLLLWRPLRAVAAWPGAAARLRRPSLQPAAPTLPCSTLAVHARRQAHVHCGRWRRSPSRHAAWLTC